MIYPRERSLTIYIGIVFWEKSDCLVDFNTYSVK